ncbi:MAG: hypothetical protein MRY83_10585, partial [Flavobacteriales bacterium]|nr:hypothetical protein [Flavobacteriales bacterium]
MHSCLGEQPEGDKFTNTQQLKDIKDKGFKIIKTPYNDFGSTEKFYYATVRKSDTGREKLILLNQEFKELKNIELNSSQSRFKIFDSFVILVEDNDSSKTLTRLYFPSFQEAEIYRNESAQIILDSLRQSTPDSILKSFSPRKNSHMV